MRNEVYKRKQLDVEDSEVNLETLQKKIDDLHKKYICLADNDSTDGAVLRDELKNLVATVISSIVETDKDVKMVVRIAAKNKKKGSLADYIHQKLAAKQRAAHHCTPSCSNPV